MNRQDPIPWVRAGYPEATEEELREAENNVWEFMNYFCGMSFEELQAWKGALTENESQDIVDS